MKFRSIKKNPLASFENTYKIMNFSWIRTNEVLYAIILRKLWYNLSNILIFTINCRSYRNSFLLFLLNGLGYIWGRVGALQFGVFPFSFNSHLRLGFMCWWGSWRSGWRSHFWWVHMNSVCWRVIVTKGSSDWIQKLREEKRSVLESGKNHH